ncbi:MAG TPA: hypothetical protein VJR06_03845, partial [Nitrososphaerales archaeon]|nr:hypothetical protein [Nitrososphaerales archaeon]
MRPKSAAVALLLILSMVCSVIVIKAPPAHASASFSQDCTGATSCTMSNGIASGDLLVCVAEGQLTAGATFRTITASDSLANNFRYLGGTTGGYLASSPFLEILFANSTSGASDTIVVAWSVNGAGSTVYNFVHCMDFTGMLASKISFFDGGFASSQPNTSPIFLSTVNNYPYPPGDILIEAPVFMPCNTGTVTLTPGFTALGAQSQVDGQCSSSPNAGFLLQFQTAYFIGWPGGQQSFPTSSTVAQAPTLTSRSNELGFGFQPLYTATQPVQATAINGATTQTVTLTGCSPSPSTYSGDGAVHNIAVSPNCTMTMTLPSGFVWLDTFTTTRTVATCNGVSTCSTFSDKYLPGTVTQPLQATATGGASTQTVTLSGCSATPSSFSGDGGTHN